MMAFTEIASGHSDAIALLPQPFFDETLYGYVGRIHLFGGGVFGHETSEYLFGHVGAALHQDFPHCLDTFSRRIGGQLGSATQIAQQLTVAPYFLRFKPDEVRHEAYAALAGDTIDRLKHHLGLPAAPCRARLSLRFCPECTREDSGQHGVTYWRRIHQLPGSLFCIHHECLLTETLHRPERRRLTKLLLPDLSIDSTEPLSLDREATETLRRLSVKDGAILRRELPMPYRSEQMQSAYRHGLRAMGLLTPGGLIRATDYLAYLHQRYRGLRNIEPFSWVLSKPHEETLLRMVRKPRTDFHPVYHLLTIDALFRDWVAFESAYAWERQMEPPEDLAAEKPLSEKNPEITAFLNALVKAGPGANVSALARQFGVELSTAMRWAGRVGFTEINRRPKVVDHEMKAAIKAALRQGGAQRDVARIHGLSRATVDRICNEEMGLHAEWQLARGEHLKAEYRAQFLAYRREHPDTGRVGLRTPESGYGWLSRNDAQWLRENLPPIQRPSSRRVAARRSIVDWTERDGQCLSALIKLSNGLAFERSERIKPGTIVRKLPPLSFAPRLERLPQSRLYVEQLVKRFSGVRKNLNP